MTTAANLSIGLFYDDAIGGSGLSKCSSGARSLSLLVLELMVFHQTTNLLGGSARTTLEVAKYSLTEAALEAGAAGAAILHQFSIGFDDFLQVADVESSRIGNIIRIVN